MYNKNKEKNIEQWNRTKMRGGGENLKWETQNKKEE